MKSRLHPASPLRPLLFLLLTSTLAGAGETPVMPPLENFPPPAADAKSAGLLNDALRQASPALSQWDIGGQIRMRYELKDDAGSFPQRDFLAGDSFNDNDYFLFREKLHIGWQPLGWLKFFVEGRGSQTGSDDRPMDPERDGADLHQAWIQLGDAKLFPLTLKIGRQEMTYGDQRFIGLGDWGNIPRSFDAVTVRTSLSEKSWIDLFTGRVVIPRDDHFNVSNDYDQFSGLYASSQEILTGVETQAFLLARNVGPESPNAAAPAVGGPGRREVYTYGARLKSLPGALGNWDFAFEGAGQFGSVGEGAQRRDLEAFALTGTLGYTFTEGWAKPRIAVGYDYASGDSDAGDDEQGTFEPLFGTNHSLYGVMDLVGLRNLSSPRISLTLKPTAKLSLSVDYLLFWLADTADSFYPESGGARSQNGYGKHPDYSSFAGSELDVVAKYAATSWAELQVGYGHFFPGDYVKESIRGVPSNPGITGADWVYVQTVINF